ncbi:MAG: tRNA pseudouridine(38-40) synthase TruA [Bacteroidales bacterium]|nr:tRNA pseudouridine(38-40) synthase TruA [Bacteroidales bacterium]
MMRYFLHLAYNGKNYFGWQIQPDRPSVQACLENVFSNLLHEKIGITGAGRTDTGVHATDFYAHLDTTQDLTTDRKQWLHRINAFLPEDIVVYDILSVRPEAHARFDALERQYRYTVSYQKNPFVTESAYRIYFKPDMEAMNHCAAMLKEYRDFTSFSKLHTQTKTNICEIHHAAWREENGLLLFEISANRFLRNMVRAIVGTLLEVGRHKITPDAFRALIEAKNRCEAGSSVPAHALCLTHILYPEWLFCDG